MVMTAKELVRLLKKNRLVWGKTGRFSLKVEKRTVIEM